MSTLLGIDLQSIDEVEASIDAFGERYTRRVFTAREIADCADSLNHAQQFALRFAAKEAVMKVLGLRDGRPPWTTIEVCDTPLGEASVSLSGVAAESARLSRIETIHLSLSHNGAFAIATVIADTVPSTDGVSSE